MVVALDLNAIASLGSAVALLIFSAVTVAHFRTYRQTGANLFVLVVALIATLGTFVVFTTTTLVNEPTNRDRPRRDHRPLDHRGLRVEGCRAALASGGALNEDAVR